MKTLYVYVQIPADSEFGEEFKGVIKTSIDRTNKKLKKLRIEIQSLEQTFTTKVLSILSELPLESDLAIFAVANGSDIFKVSPDVTYKMGYFWTSNKDVILLIKGKERPDPHSIPGNVQILAYWDKPSLEKVREELPEKLRQMALKRIASWPECYTVACFQDRAGSLLIDAISEAKFKIDLLTTNLAMFSREPYRSVLKKVLSESGKPDLTLRMLTLDPQSVFVAYRAIQLGLPIKAFREELSNSLQILYGELPKLAGRVEIRTYDDFPTQITFMIDEFVYSCTVARSIRSRGLCTFKLPKDALGVERSFIFHFTTLWTIAKPYGRVG